MAGLFKSCRGGKQGGELFNGSGHQPEVEGRKAFFDKLSPPTWRTDPMKNQELLPALFPGPFSAATIPNSSQPPCYDGVTKKSIQTHYPPPSPQEKLSTNFKRRLFVLQFSLLSYQPVRIFSFENLILSGGSRTYEIVA